MPFQGVNNQYLQVLTRLTGTPEYAEIRMRRVNHGWESRVENLSLRYGFVSENGTLVDLSRGYGH
jgi:hypothetical protein